MTPSPLLAALLSVLCLAGQSSAKNSLQDLEKSLNLGWGLSLRAVTSAETVFGTRQARLQFLCYGLPVVDHSFVAEQDNRGDYTGRTSTANVPDCQDDVRNKKKCVVPQSVVEGYIADFVQENNKTGKPMQKLFEVQSSAIRTIGSDSVVVKQVDFLYQNDRLAVRGYLVIDACSGNLISEWNKAALNREEIEGREKRAASSACPEGTGGNPVLGDINYGDGDEEICLDVKSAGDQCSLQNDAGRVLSANSPGGCLGGSPVSFPCSEGPNDAVNGANSPALDAINGINTINNVLSEWYDFPMPVSRPDVCVNFGVNFTNAVWTGNQILLGDGRSGFSKPFATLGAVCHEYAHAIVDEYSRLSFEGQTGGLNDAFADAFSRVCRNYAGVDDTWYEGRGLLDGFPQGFRSYQNPTSDGFSIDNANDFQPDLDSHYAAGVFNRFFYCLAEEQGTSIRDAFRPMLLSNQLRWVELTDFQTAACDVLRSSVDSGVNTDSVRSCLNVVGLSVDSCSLDSVEQVLCKGDGKLNGVTVSASRNPYFRVCASDSNSVTVTTEPSVTVIFSKGSAYAEAETSGNGRVSFNGDLSNGDVYVRLQGSSSVEQKVDVRAKF